MNILVFFSDFKEKDFSFSLLNIMLSYECVTPELAHLGRQSPSIMTLTHQALSCAKTTQNQVPGTSHSLHSPNPLGLFKLASPSSALPCTQWKPLKD